MRYLTNTYLPQTMVNQMSLTDNEALGYYYITREQAEIVIEYAKAQGITEPLQVEPVENLFRVTTRV